MVHRLEVIYGDITKQKCVLTAIHMLRNLVKYKDFIPMENENGEMYFNKDL